MTARVLVWTENARTGKVGAVVEDGGYRKRVGARIRRARKAKGWTVTRLAHELDIAEKQIRRWENGHNMPQPRNLDALGDKLDVTAEWFLRDDDN